ncbi:MAG: GNAT family N-acetyltransferase [Betaproteobacteria bacterium]
MPAFELRTATLDDVPTLAQLIADSCRKLCVADYTPEQIEAALGSAWGVDSQLILDATYFVAQSGAEVVGCGGWSRRRTLFGADGASGRSATELTPGRDAAKVRAFFVRPDWARKGVGRAILDRCEHEAQAAGFAQAELMATLTGVRLYTAMGYQAQDPITFTLPGAVGITFVPMHKTLTAEARACGHTTAERMPNAHQRPIIPRTV